MEEGTVRVSLAGIQPITEEGDVLRIIFNLKGSTQGTSTVQFDIKRLLLNEKNMTSDASGVTVGIDEGEAIPTTFGLEQNYPNPFNPSTTIRYQLPTASTISIKVFDMLGREVRDLLAAAQPAGRYNITWNGTNDAGEGLASGLYLYRIRATGGEKETFTMVRKMVLLK